ncbi:mutarotase [Litoribacter populi]|uniref:mutarotase n=1 Tax=Litoribacter populi TaxID=2598460 RepID=UPI00118062E0|nr:mutarotase [Litoribacter populi]
MDMDLHYEQLYLNAVDKIKKDDYYLDKLIHDNTDTRYGLSLIIKPDAQICNNMLDLLNSLREVEPQQYYYPLSDIHITVLSIISCYSGFRPANLNLQSYAKEISECVSAFRSFPVYFKGITASPSGVMVQGFCENDILNNIRDRLRNKFRNSNLQHSIDKRYVIQTAHTTIVRFQSPFLQKDRFLEILHQFRNKNFGQMEVGQMQLVGNDWYHKREKVQVIDTLPMKT